MDALTIVGFLAMLGLTLAYVGWPLLSPARAEAPETGKERRSVALGEEKDRLLGALRDLEHDHQTGKMDDADFAALSAKVKGEAAKVLKDIDVNEGRKVLRPGEERPAPDSASVSVSASAAGTGTPSGAGAATGSQQFCTKCGRPARADDAFCGRCGAAIHPD